MKVALNHTTEEFLSASHVARHNDITEHLISDVQKMGEEWAKKCIDDANVAAQALRFDGRHLTFGVEGEAWVRSVACDRIDGSTFELVHGEEAVAPARLGFALELLFSCRNRTDEVACANIMSPM